MKRILLVSDEKMLQDMGLIAQSAKYGLVYNIPNLRAAFARAYSSFAKFLPPVLKWL